MWKYIFVSIIAVSTLISAGCSSKTEEQKAAKFWFGVDDSEKYTSVADEVRKLKGLPPKAPNQTAPQQPPK